CLGRRRCSRTPDSAADHAPPTSPGTQLLPSAEYCGTHPREPRPTSAEPDKCTEALDHIRSLWCSIPDRRGSPMSNEREEELLASVPGELFVGGSWRSGHGGATFDVRDPATGAVIKQVADATGEDAESTMDAAVDAFPSWSATPARERSELLRRAFERLQERAEDFALLMTLEMGKPLAESRGEVAYGGEFLRWFAEEAPRIQGRYGPTPEGTGQMIVSQHPVGPCYLITPWNFPLAMATRKIA